MWTAIVVCLAALFALDRAFPLLERLVAIREGELALQSKPTPRPEAVSIPRDLYAVALSYGDEWARDQALQAMREMYGESGSWDMVRVRYGLAAQEGK